MRVFGRLLLLTVEDTSIRQCNCVCSELRNSQVSVVVILCGPRTREKVSQGEHLTRTSAKSRNYSILSLGYLVKFVIFFCAGSLLVLLNSVVAYGVSQEREKVSLCNLSVVACWDLSSRRESARARALEPRTNLTTMYLIENKSEESRQQFTRFITSQHIVDTFDFDVHMCALCYVEKRSTESERKKL